MCVWAWETSMWITGQTQSPLKAYMRGWKQQLETMQHLCSMFKSSLTSVYTQTYKHKLTNRLTSIYWGIVNLPPHEHNWAGLNWNQYFHQHLYWCVKKNNSLSSSFKNTMSSHPNMLSASTPPLVSTQQKTHTCILPSSICSVCFSSPWLSLM